MSDVVEVIGNTTEIVEYAGEPLDVVEITPSYMDVVEVAGEQGPPGRDSTSSDDTNYALQFNIALL